MNKSVAMIWIFFKKIKFLVSSEIKIKFESASDENFSQSLLEGFRMTYACRNLYLRN